jgi:predicted permease
MSILRAIRDGLRRLTSRASFERDLEDEVEHFVEEEARGATLGGLDPGEALRVARARLGGVERIKEDARAGGWEFVVDTFIHDLRYALRTLRRNVGYTSAAIATLAIGIGGSTAVFTIVNAAFLRPPAEVRAPDELVSIYTSDYSGPPYGSSSYPDIDVFREQTHLFSGVVAVAPRPIGIGEGDDLRNEGLELVSADYFATLGVRLALGRGFGPDEGRTGVPVAVTVISHTLWQQDFGGSRHVIGQSVRLNGRPFSIIGVAPSGYRGAIRGIAISAWIPVPAGALIGNEGGERERGNRSYLVTARLAPGVTVEQATAGLATVARNLAQSYPEAWLDVTRTGRRISVLSEAESRVPPQVRGPVLGFAGLLLGTMVLVLLVCCANVAGLTLARAARRAREMGVRLSLGASRRRVVRQLLTESSVVAVAGAAGGVGLALLVSRGLNAWRPPLPLEVALDLRLDARVLLVALGIAVATVLLFGLAPALRASRAAVSGMLKGDEGAIAVGGRRRVSLQGALVTAQVAISMLLLVGAMLFVRSLHSASQIDPGFAPDHLLLVDVEPRPDLQGPTDEAGVAAQLQRQIGGLPGVTSVSWGSTSPLALGSSRRYIQIDGYRPAEGEDMEYHYNFVGPRYVDALGGTIVAGRGISDADVAGAPLAVVVNEAFARRFWRGESPLGKRLTPSEQTPDQWHVVVGVSRTAKYRSLTEEPLPYLYFPALQEPGHGVVLHVRTAVHPLSVRDAVRREVAAVAPTWQVRSVRSMEQQMGVSLTPQRTAGVLLSLFGLVAVMLAAVGLYGVVALAVAARRREIGIRMALGATARGVVRLVVGDGARLVLIGIALGLPAGWAIARLLGAFLIGEAARSVVTFAAATVVLVMIALAAAWMPARRAARIRPMMALRDE